MTVKEFLEEAERHKEHWHNPVFDGDGTPLKTICRVTHSESFEGCAIELHFNDSDSATLTMQNVINELLRQPEEQLVVERHNWEIDTINFVADPEDGNYFDVF